MIPRFRCGLGLREIVGALGFGGHRDIERFERAFAGAMGQEHAVAFPYGRTALVALLRGLGIERRAVVCPAYTCVVVPHGIVHSDNVPHFVDSGPDANMDLSVAEEIVERHDAAMLIATSIFGHSVDLDSIQAIRQRRPNLFVLQDCAHSFEARWHDVPVQREGNAALFGLNISKIATSIFGGMLTTDDETLARRVRNWRGANVSAPRLGKQLQRFFYMVASCLAFRHVFFGVVHRLTRSGSLTRLTDYYDEAVIDLPSDAFDGISPVEARVGRIQIEKADELINARRRYAERYRSELGSAPGIAFPNVPKGSSFSHVVGAVADRPAIREAARRSGIELGHVIEYSIPEMTAYREQVQGETFPVASYLARHVVNLPVDARFSPQQADRVVAALRPILVEASSPELPDEMREGWE